MRIDKFTQKGQEALLEAQNLAQKYNHPAVKPEHLLKVLVEQEGGVVPSVLKRIGVDTDTCWDSGLMRHWIVYHAPRVHRFKLEWIGT